MMISGEQLGPESGSAGPVVRAQRVQDSTCPAGVALGHVLDMAVAFRLYI